MKFDISTITGLTSDSRQVNEGNLFVALTGSKQDGNHFIPDAIAKGAKFVAVKKGTQISNLGQVSLIEVDNSHQFLSETAALFYKDQPVHIVAVTGTNGKTSTVNFARMIWDAMGYQSASLGTLGLIGKGLEGYAGMTTPDPVTLFSTLADISQKGFTHLAMEASSHGLHQYRLDGVKVKAAGFTNLTRDHLDYHDTMENYLHAKLRLFIDILMTNGTAVLNADIPEFQVILNHIKSRGLNIISYGFNPDATIRIIDRSAVATGQDVTLKIDNKTFSFHLNLVGEFQLMNVLCALGLVISDKSVSIDKALSVLPNLQGIIGRLQPVPHAHKDIGVYIDYAHTPDGLETILNSLRPHTKNKLICVFGCGGDRDRGKRPVMGDIANRLSDMAIVTDDNPRTEDPQFIRSEILSGAPNAIEIAGRRNAIQFAVKNLKAGDVLVVAGKGHEQGQIFADHTEPFDDLTETQTALQSLLS